MPAVTIYTLTVSKITPVTSTALSSLVIKDKLNADVALSPRFNSTSKTYSAIINADAGTITVVKADNNAVVSYSISDSNNEGTITPSSDGSSATFNLVSEGRYTIKVVIEDPNGSVASTTYTLTVGYTTLMSTRLTSITLMMDGNPDPMPLTPPFDPDEGYFTCYGIEDSSGTITVTTEDDNAFVSYGLSGVDGTITPAANWKSAAFSFNEPLNVVDISLQVRDPAGVLPLQNYCITLQA